MSNETIKLFDSYGLSGEHCYGNHSMSMSYTSQIIERYFNNFDNDEIIVDIASGDGRFARNVRDINYDEGRTPKVVQLDISMIGLELSEGLKARSLATETPLASNSVKAIHFKDALVHIPPEDRYHLMCEFYRIIQPGGFALVVSQSLYDNFFTYRYRNGTHTFNQYILNKKDFVKLARSFKSDSIIGEVSPPYFKTTEYSVINTAHSVGFFAEETIKWEPMKHEKEWHSGAESRFIVVLRKPEEWL